MKLYSTLVVLAQLAMFGGLVQATFTTNDILRYSTRELVDELQTRMIMAKRSAFLTAHPQLDRRSISYDEVLQFTSRGGTGTPNSDAVPVTPQSTDASATGTGSVGGGHDSTLGSGAQPVEGSTGGNNRLLSAAQKTRARKNWGALIDRVKALPKVTLPNTGT